jgi:hypothetical protein
MVKGEEVMPVPGGEITSTETWSENQAAYDAAMEEAIEDAKEVVENSTIEVEDDLPELS